MAGVALVAGMVLPRQSGEAGPPGVLGARRPDGGWDQLGVSEATASSSGGNNASGGNPPVFWSRWVINAGTFGRDGRERWPSREVRADADSAIGIMWRVQHTPVVAADTSATPWPEALLRPAPVVVGVLPRWR